MADESDTDSEKVTASEQHEMVVDLASVRIPERFPKTIVLSLTTHGLIVVGMWPVSMRPKMFRVPRDITLVKMNAVMPTICNHVNEADVVHINELITDKINGMPVLDAKDLRQICEDIRPELLKYSDSSIAGLYSSIKEKLKKKERGEVLTEEEGEALEREQAYLHSVDRGYIIIDGTGSEMINKQYVRDNKDALNPFGDWQIKALNLPGQPDLINEIERENGRMTGARVGEATTSLEEIINFCASRGSDRILIFDLTCSNVTTDSSYEREDFFKGKDADRARRAYAQDILESAVKWGGTKKKRTLKKTQKPKKTKNSNRKIRKNSNRNIRKNSNRKIRRNRRTRKNGRKIRRMK
jgi:hypothetical protein